MKKILLSLLFCAALLPASPAFAGEAAKLAVQHNGRVKTLDTFAREILTLVHGRGKFEKRPALDWLYTAAADPSAVGAWKWIRIDYPLLVEALELPKGRHFFSYDEVIPAAGKIEALGRSATSKRDDDKTPSLLERKAESLYQALVAIKAVREGTAFRVVPPAQGASDPSWRSPFDSAPPERAREFRDLASAHKRGDEAAFEKQVREWNAFVRDRTGGRHARTLSLEYAYMKSHPFGWASLLYFTGFLLVWARKRAFAAKLGTLAILVGFIEHTAGLALRIGILERPPVSNMYESIVWMSWVLVLVALVTAAARRELVVAGVGAIAGAVVTLYGDLLPMDSGLDVLVPVLRSNYWLTIHVLTIVSSYSVFGLAMALGHRHLFLHVQKKWKHADELRSASLIYRTIQVGMLMLGIGTVLGGVWANESWGRFWGWDPKETWALITFLGYLVLVHLHFARIVKPFALAVSAILGFGLVMFTWYGVNFVLGRGLHSYGQGSGGMNWIYLYMAAEAVFFGWIYVRVTKR